MLMSLREGGLAQCGEGLDTLTRRYWDAICSYVRVEWSTANDEAEDLTQEFFLWLVQTEVLKRYAPDRGSFRSYLKGLLRNFRRHERRAAHAKKRGGGKALLSLDHDHADEPVDPRTLEAERAFDAAWVGIVTKRALDRIRERIGADTLRWRIYAGYDLEPEEGRPTYAALAERLGIKSTDVRNHIFAVRERLREAIRLELSDTVANERDLEKEWRLCVDPS
jgi:RNA polymerase sigma-70 factor (ECF subfamily)